MASNRIVRELFRSLETTLQERLSMIEDVLRLGNIRATDGEVHEQDGLVEKLAQLEGMVSSLAARLDAMELSKRDVHGPVAIETVHVNHIGKDTILEQDVKGLEVRVKPECTIAAPLRASVALPTVVIAQPLPVSAPPPSRGTEIVSSHESIQIENEVAISDEEVEEEVEEEVVEEEVVEEEVEEEVEEAEEAIELKEFTFKGKTYYMDGEQQVYGVDAEGELIEQPIGTWDEARQRVLFRRAAS